jgi:hypothetical protein
MGKRGNKRTLRLRKQRARQKIASGVMDRLVNRRTGGYHADKLAD